MSAAPRDDSAARESERATHQLRRNAEEQVERLVTQLSDLDSLREVRECSLDPVLEVLTPGAGPGGGRVREPESCNAEAAGGVQRKFVTYDGG